MIYKNAESAERPASVRMQKMPDGTISIRLSDNIREEIREEVRQEEHRHQTMYVYDEATFTLEEGSKETEDDILTNFYSWWAFASEQPEETEPELTDTEALNIIMGEE